MLVLGMLLAGCSRLPGGGTRQGGGDLEMQARVEAQVAVARPPFVTADAEGRKLWGLTAAFYKARGHEPAWIEGRSPRRQIRDLVDALKGSRADGLDPELYGLTALEARVQEASRGFLSKKGFKAEEAGALDVWLTYIYMKFASDLADGLSDLARVDAAWQIQPEQFDPLAHLARALEDNSIKRSLGDLMPTAPQYRELRKALAAHRTLAERGGWPAVPANARIKPGQRAAVAGAIARRLAASGDYSGPVSEREGSENYSLELQDAVKRFQRRHGLEPDGIVGPAVAAEMNVPVGARIDQIALNMERWRWLPRDLGARHILVNIPAYQLEVWDNGRVPLAMRVVVGKKESATPIFDDRMTYVVFSPYWNVPPDIARDETLPSMLSDRGFLERTNMEIVDRSGSVVDPSDVDASDTTKYRFRQRPGGSNSLGLVKFMFPNQFNVYLHDTPADALFERAGRSLSHGCVRVEQPEALAAYVLSDQPDWTAERIAAAMHSGQEQTVKLKSPLPVYLGYFTASVAADGSLQFLNDVYGVDKRQQQLLAGRVARIRQSTSEAPVEDKAVPDAKRGTPAKQPGSRGAAPVKSDRSVKGSEL